MLKDVTGTAALQDALTRTNELLADVLEQLKETNGVRLEAVVTELRGLARTPYVTDEKHGPDADDTQGAQ